MRSRHELSSAERKMMPVDRGFMKYFPDAIMLVALLSYRGNQKHAPGQPIQWVRGVSNDQGDCLGRHQLDAGTIDPDLGVDGAIEVAWRAMAQLQLLAEQKGYDGLVDWDWKAPTSQRTESEIDLRPGKVILTKGPPGDLTPTEITLARQRWGLERNDD